MTLVAETTWARNHLQIRSNGRQRRRVVLLLCLIVLLAAGIGLWFARQMERTRLRLQLVSAVRNDDAASVRRLLDQGADPDVRLDYRRESFSWNRVWRMLRGGQAAEEPQDITVLMRAALYDRREIVRLLLEHGANVGQIDFPGQEWTAADYAASVGNTYSLELLLEHGADPNRRGLSGVTLIIRAICGEPPGVPPVGEGCLPLLVRHGARIDMRMEDGETPLMFAINQGSTDNLRYLLDHGVDVNAVDITERTALTHAVGNLDPDRVRMLLAAGAQVDTRDHIGKTALHSLISNARLRNRVVATNRRKEYLGLIRLLLANGADPDVRDKEGISVRQAADLLHDPDITALLQNTAPAPTKRGRMKDKG